MDDASLHSSLLDADIAVPPVGAPEEPLPVDNPPPGKTMPHPLPVRTPAAATPSFAYGVDPFENNINPATSDGQKLW